jgi:hypothetical protein
VQQNPDLTVSYRDGVELDGTGGRPATLGPGTDLEAPLGEVPWWWQWMPLRALDSQSPPRCQVAWLPAL